MRLVPLAILIAGVSLGQNAPSEAKRAKIEELLVLQRTEWQMKEALTALDTYIANTKKQAGLEESAAAIEKEKRDSVMLRERLSWERMKERYVALYHETYNEGELDALIAFHKTPGGKAQVEKMPKVLEENLKIPQQVIVKLMPEIQQMVTETLEKVKR